VVADRISSPSNPRIKAFARLKKARVRSESGLFLIEGEREVGRALAAGVELEALLVCDELLTLPAPALDDLVDVVRTTPIPMAKVSVRQNPSGIIAVARQFDTNLEALRLGPRPLVLIAEAVEKPGNLGAMMRTADSAGADAVVIADAATDVFNPNVVRASQGALFLVPLAIASTADAIAWAAARSLNVVGGYLDGATDLWDANLGQPTAIVVGAEDVGLSAAWSGVATRVRIPMAGRTDSLNASVAAALMLYEAVRQRKPPTQGSQAAKS
jgi:TrmH family RNA methyltransferase